MRSTFSILPYINRSKVKADGTTAVLCRITIDGKSSTMATGIYCRPEDWNSSKGTIRTVRENNRLQEFRKSVELAYEDSLKKQNVVSAERSKMRWQGKPSSPPSCCRWAKGSVNGCLPVQRRQTPRPPTAIRDITKNT